MLVTDVVITIDFRLTRLFCNSSGGKATNSQDDVLSENAPTAALENQVEQFLSAWFGVRQLVQSLNFNRFHRQGMSATQFMLMQLLENTPREEAHTIGGLAAQMNLDGATVVRTVDSLEKRGLLTRRRDSKDRRQVFVEFTERGRQTQQTMHQDFKNRLVAILGAMPEDKRRGLIEGLEEFLATSRHAESSPSEED